MRGASRGGPEVEQPGREAPEMRRPNPAGAEAGRPASVSAAPARVLRTHAPGRPRPAARRHDDRLPAVLRSDGLNAAETKERHGRRSGSGPEHGPVSARKRGYRGQKPPHVERRVASAPIARRAAADEAARLRCATRRSTPSLFLTRGNRTTAYPAPQRIRAMSRALLLVFRAVIPGASRRRVDAPSRANPESSNE
jgi:hypothetical protein